MHVYILLDPHSCARVLKYALKNHLILSNAKKSSSSTSVPTGEYLKKSVSCNLKQLHHLMSIIFPAICSSI